MKNYHPPASELWQGRRSDLHLYWHEHVVPVNLKKDTTLTSDGVALLGYSCDEGVRRNRGRVGASAGPDAIRGKMAVMAWHCGISPVYDCGNIACVNGDLSTAQRSLGKAVHAILSNGSFPIVLGGGHDIAYGMYQGIQLYMEAKASKGRLGIINFDAHFDLRKPKPKGNSGTPFYQIARKEMSRGSSINYYVLGIQRSSNTQDLFDRAQELNATIVTNDELHNANISGLSEQLEQFMKHCDKIYLSIDMDVFASAYAPGVSAPSALGCTPNVVLHLIQIIASSGRLMCMDIAEMNPLYDIDDRTAQLAATIVEHVVRSRSINN